VAQESQLRRFGSRDFTQMMPGRADFAPTQWRLLKRTASEDDGEAAAALAELAREYWRPVYAYVRARFRTSNEESKDLTQAFFLWMLEQRIWQRADERRGRFRAFLKRTLQNFVLNRFEAERALKRGGGRSAVALDLAGPDLPAEPAAQASPDQALDAQWREEVLGKALRRMEAWYRAEGKEVQFRVFEAHDLVAEAPEYGELADRFKVSPKDVSNFLTRARERLKAYVQENVAESVDSLEDLQAELTELFGGSPVGG
jgi:RNA polymerase sigma-70 factor (ECF subfamily)